jgi:hypothetical protein
MIQAPESLHLPIRNEEGFYACADVNDQPALEWAYRSKND